MAIFCKNGDDKIERSLNLIHSKVTTLGQNRVFYIVKPTYISYKRDAQHGVEFAY
jgi:hypothetical protein